MVTEVIAVVNSEEEWGSMERRKLSRVNEKIWILVTRASQVALVVKNPPASWGDTRDVGLIPGLERSPGVGNCNPLQYSCLRNLMDRGSWQATVYRIAKSWTCLKLSTELKWSQGHTHRHTHTHTRNTSLRSACKICVLYCLLILLQLKKGTWEQNACAYTYMYANIF